MRKIVIVGGGFGGIRAALDLIKKRLPDTSITLISDKPHFEYHAALYRVVTGRSPLEVCVPLREIFSGTSIEVIEDSVAGANLANRTLMGESGSRYQFDFLILALGSETAYFNIPGLKELSYGFKSIQEALRLKRHLNETFEACAFSSTDQKVCAAHIVIVGGGASGVESAGELAVYAKHLALRHHLDPSLVTIDLIEAAPRLLPALPEDISIKTASRLRELDVNVFLNRTVVKEEISEVYLKDMKIKTNTLIWTAGMKPNHLYAEIEGLTFDNRGRVVVDRFLQAQGFENIFVIGDGAATPYSGMTQTALRDGRFAAKTIVRKILGQTVSVYVPRRTAYAIPVGPNWAAVLIGQIRVYGATGWLVRRLADLRFFLSILPVQRAIIAFKNNKTLCESCSVCMPGSETSIASSNT